MNIEHFHNQTFNGLVTYMNEIGHSGQANGNLKMEKRHFSAAKYLILGLISLAAAENSKYLFIYLFIDLFHKFIYYVNCDFPDL